MRLLRDANTREVCAGTGHIIAAKTLLTLGQLIDALFYDFDPLQGLTSPRTGNSTPVFPRVRTHARISTVEIAIRAQAKRFLAHPLVVQQLEAVWAGTIVFHSAADQLHRIPRKRIREETTYGTTEAASPRTQPSLPNQTIKFSSTTNDTTPQFRRSVTLYDPSDASLFKLSRLRVPRYRQLFSTISYAIMLGLFLAVLIERSLDITALEIVFWFWSAGYMLDEIVGFTEQGFGLYILSFWNTFDIGILLLFMAYYILRLYGILMPDVRKRRIANMAYDVLASTAVLLLPRLFSVLDHYRYFSQLLIAFRMMAVDLIAVMILIIISCSGFFVAFTLSFSDTEFDAASAAYALFQILMGFTPAAWAVWDDYNFLGKAIMTIFLIICHFIIVTVLITVLTNSFMAIVQNANEEHQFLFAVNTISMVKSDALFSYIPPTNVLGWLLTPLRYIMPFHQFVKLNRTIIKVTHLPILWAIFAYERLILSRLAYEPTELVEQRGRVPSRLPAFSIRGPNDLFSPRTRLREPSVTTFHKDQALEEVFRRPMKSPPLEDRSRRGSMYDRSKTSNVVQDWMVGVGQQGGAASPIEQPPSVVERLETRRPTMRRFKTTQAISTIKRRNTFTKSEPEVAPSNAITSTSPEATRSGYGFPDMSLEELPQQTDADGDDELATNDEDDRPTYERSFLETEENGSDKENSRPGFEPEDVYFRTPKAARRIMSPTADSSISQIRQPADSPQLPSTQQRTNPPPKREKMHSRNVSSGTILFSPLKPKDNAYRDDLPRSSSPKKVARTPRTEGSGPAETAVAAGTSGTATPRKVAKRKENQPSPSAVVKARPIYPPASLHRPAPNLATFLALDRRKPSFNARALDLASDLGDNRYGPDAAVIGAIPASFGTQMEMAAYQQRLRGRMWNNGEEEDDDADGDGDGRGATRRLNRMMLQRMSNLEEGFKEVLREVKRVSRAGSVEDEEVPKKKGRKERRGRSSMGKERARHAESDREGKRVEDDAETAATRTSV